MPDFSEEERQKAIDWYRRAIAGYKPPTPRPPDFLEAVHSAVTNAGVPKRLGAASAVVLEKVAEGAGETRWYFCRDQSFLEAIEARLQPGSRVSFYFDRRLDFALYTTEVRARVEAIPRELGPVLGYLTEDGIQIKMILDIEPDEFDEYSSELANSPLVVFGEFPASDNDGTNAITITVPAADGLVRMHVY